MNEQHIANLPLYIKIATNLNTTGGMELLPHENGSRLELRFTRDDISVEAKEKAFYGVLHMMGVLTGDTEFPESLQTGNSVILNDYIQIAAIQNFQAQLAITTAQLAQPAPAVKVAAKPVAVPQGPKAAVVAKPAVQPMPRPVAAARPATPIARPVQVARPGAPAPGR